VFFYFLMVVRPSSSTLFPYTTLFRSRFDFHLEAVGQHVVDFLFPHLVLAEPGVVEDFAGSFAVGVAEGDLDIVAELALLVVLGADADELGIGDGEALGLERQADRALLDDAVDVMPPGVAVEQAINRQAEFLVQPPQQAADAARRLAGALGEDAVVLLPEAVLVEAAPDRVLFDVEDELGFALL